MGLSAGILLISSLVELGLLITIVILFIRLRRSEVLLKELRHSQKELLDKLTFNAELEREIVRSFEERQRELSVLDAKLEERIGEAKALLKQLREFSSSPKVLKQLVISGYKRGESKRSLARRTGLSLEEIEWILEQEDMI